MVLLFLLIVGQNNTVSAQFSISGTIRDNSTGRPMQGASISSDNKLLATASDGNGNYLLKSVGSGKFVMKVSYMGFKTIRRELVLHRDTMVDFDMECHALLGDEVNITATRAQEKTPVTYSSIPSSVIRENNMGKDLPYILQTTPSVVVTSDAGTGIGYTGITIRGSDLTRINVTVNGIPLNDPESQGVWFVDVPDLASSTDNIQIQRGVGTSTNGSGAFGASINIQTNTLDPEPNAEISSAAGSFNSLKNTLKFGTGLLSNHFSFSGRISMISSDGYIDRGSSRLNSYNLTGGFFGKNTTLRFNIITGKEKTYQAWEGVPKDSLKTNRTFNPSGLYYDRNGNIAYYENQTDNYQQDNYQFLFSQTLGKSLNINAALHYTKGKGYYENYESGQLFSDYGLSDVVIGQDTIRTTDLVNQKWLDNDFYGLTFSANYHLSDKLKITIGGAANQYYGRHFGKVTWAQYASEGDNERKWYNNIGLKNDMNVYAKATWSIIKQINLFADLQYRHIYYRISGTQDDKYIPDLDWLKKFDFFNPKAGIYADLSTTQQAYFSFGVSHREPNRNNYENADKDHVPFAEKLYDYELGYQLRLKYFTAGANLYYMDYTDQLVLTGALNNVGEAIMINVPNSYRAGIELTADARFFKWLKWNCNMTLSRNKIKKFTEYVDMFDSDWNFLGQNNYQHSETDLSFSPNFLLNNTFTFIPFPNMTFSLNSRYVGKQYIDNTSSDDRSLNGYFINGISAGYTIHTKYIKEIGLNLGINNLFSSEYESNAWVYRCFVGGAETVYDGYFPQAPINFMLGISLKI